MISNIFLVKENVFLEYAIVKKDEDLIDDDDVFEIDEDGVILD